MNPKPKPGPPPTLTQRAEKALATNGPSVFVGKHAKIETEHGPLGEGEWKGPLIERATVHEPTTITRAWRVYFWPQKWYAMLPAELTREEAQQAAEVLMELTEMRRVK